MEELIAVLQNFGFPVAVCGVLMWYIKDINDKFSEQLKDIMNQHKDESDKTVEAINNNTLVMQRFIDKVGGIND